MKFRPGGGTAGDDGDVSLLSVSDRGRIGAQHGSTLLTGQHTLAVLSFLTLLVIINHPDVLGHLFELVGQTLTFHLCKNATLVVIPTKTDSSHHVEL